MSDQRFRSMLTRIRRSVVFARRMPGAEPRAVVRFGPAAGLASASGSPTGPVRAGREGVRFADRLVRSSGDHRDLSPRERELVEMQAELARLVGRSGEPPRGD